MVNCPIQDGALFKTGKREWVRISADHYISQRFKENPQIYKVFNMLGHNGIDFARPIGTPVFAPHDGVVKVKDSGKKGYGLHVRIRNSYKKMESVLGHLYDTAVKTGDKVFQGQLVGFVGDTGFSTGPHLHWGVRTLIPNGKNVWSWGIEGYDNGYYGYWNQEPYTVTWKGSLIHKTLK